MIHTVVAMTSQGAKHVLHVELVKELRRLAPLPVIRFVRPAQRAQHTVTVMIKAVVKHVPHVALVQELRQRAPQ